jgi:hypothetical protein
MRAQLADWWQARQRDPQQESVLVALHRGSVAELNANAHALMRDAGRLGDAEITVDDRSFAAGDRVVLLRNSATLDVDNGDRGTVVDVDAGRRALTVELDAGREVRIPEWYLDAGWVDHGYALTAHKLQSTTVDRTFALASDGLYQEAGYSIATRARHETHFYLASQPDLDDHEQAHGPPQPPEDAVSRFARHLGTSRAQTLASDEPVDARARALTTTELRDEHDRVRQALDDFPVAQARALAVLAGDAGRQRTDLEDTDLRIGQTNHQLDALGFFKRHGSEGDDLRAQLERLQSQRAYVDGLYSRTVQEIRNERADNDPVAWIDHRANDIRYLRALEQELLDRDRRAERQLIAAAQIDPPDHITAVLGPRPENHATRSAWERGVAAIETYRRRHDIPPDHELSALGPAPSRTRPDPEFRDAERAVRQARTELGLGEDTLRPDRAAIPDRLSEPPPRERGLSRDHDLSIDL